MGLITQAQAFAKYNGITEAEAAEALEAPETEAEVSSVAPLPGGQPVQDTAYNGAQVTSAQGIIESVANGQIPRSSAVAMLQTFFLMSEAEARAIVQDIDIKAEDRE